MKKNALVTTGLVILLALAGNGFGFVTGASAADSVVIEKVKVEDARKTALKEIPGGILDDEYFLENDNGEIETFVFLIKNKAGKLMGVHVDADKGTVTLVENYDEVVIVDDTPSQTS